MIDLNCPHCGRALKIPEQYAGQQGMCKYCQQRITVPQVSPPAPWASPTSPTGVIPPLGPPASGTPVGGWAPAGAPFIPPPPQPRPGAAPPPGPSYGPTPTYDPTAGAYGPPQIGAPYHQAEDWPTGWCWAGFLWGPLWGLFHGQTVLGVIGLFINPCAAINIYFGIQGHELAGESYSGNARQYRNAQKGWVIAWLIVFGILFLVFLAAAATGSLQ